MCMQLAGVSSAWYTTDALVLVNVTKQQTAYMNSKHECCLFLLYRVVVQKPACRAANQLSTVN